MAISSFVDFLFPFLSQLTDKEVSSKEMKDALVRHFALTEEDRLLRTKRVYAIKKIYTDYFEE